MAYHVELVTQPDDEHVCFVNLEHMPRRNDDLYVGKALNEVEVNAGFIVCGLQQSVTAETTESQPPPARKNGPLPPKARMVTSRETYRLVVHPLATEADVADPGRLVACALCDEEWEED